MLDFSVRLRENAHLLALLSHYARPGAEDRTAWRDRVMRMDGVEPQQLTVLHGELIAFDWVEQNTGDARRSAGGALAACYRVTPHGLREFQRLHGIEAGEAQPEEAEKPPPRFARKKKERAESPAGPIAE